MPNQIVNVNAATTAVNFTGASTFYWTNDTPAIGLPASGTSNIASFTAINNGAVPVTATITVTPNPTSYAYITSLNSGTVSVINTITNTVVTTIPIATSGTMSAVVSHDGTRVYVVNQNDNTVSVINAITNTVMAKIPVGNVPQTIAVSADDSKVYVTNTRSNTISVISTSTNAVTATLITNVQPRSMCLSADGTRIYSECEGDQVVTVIDIASNAIIATIEEGFDAQGIALSPDGSMLYVPSDVSGVTPEKTRISVFSTVTFTLVRTFDVNYNSNGLSESPDGSRLYLISNNYLSVINPVNGSVIATIPVGNEGVSVAVNGDGSQVYVEDASDNNVSVISTSSNTVTATIPVGQYPLSYDNFTSRGITCGVTPVTFTITVNPSPPTITPAPQNIIISNAFTPNGDGINDTWDIKNLNAYPKCTVMIYNRWGENVYSSIGYGVPWDGTYHGAALPVGVYYYIIDRKNALKVLSGYVTIIR